VQLVDPRRLTGPNLLVWRPLVIVELSLSPDESASFACDSYLAWLGRIRESVGFSPDPGPLVVRPHQGGVVIGYDAPIDVMLACVEMSEWAAWCASDVSLGGPPLPIEPTVAATQALLDRDRSPNLLALEAEARRRKLPFLWDDDAVSVGLGKHSETWPRQELPTVDQVDWAPLGEIPIAMITGTNGKTTSTRLLARIVREAGYTVGFTSSDAITIGTKVIDSGDWTGPQAARVVLRDKSVDFAVLETARGGILRRGLALEYCDVAMITNVSPDHSGYGIDDLTAMAQVKSVIGKAARKSVVLNLDNPYLAALKFDVPIVPFEKEPPIPVSDIPITFDGAAKYNVENVRGVVAMARELGLPEDAILRGLRGFTSNDNPGRGQVIQKNRFTLLLDFAHNPDGIRGLMDLVGKLRHPNGRLFVIAGSAGDRSDHEIECMCEEIAKAKPAKVFIRELLDYLRGRVAGEISEMMKKWLAPIPTEKTESEVDAVRRAFAEAKPNDFIVMLVHLDYAGVQALLAT
jgi:UDP-N-acetylmuramyl tripeptide synthase